LRDHEDVTATRDGVVARVLSERDTVDAAVALLDAAEADLEVPLVDEAERDRLAALAGHEAIRAPHWHPVLAERDGAPVGYAGVVLPTSPGLLAVGDVAVARHQGPTPQVLGALLASLEVLAWRHLAGRLQVWIRHADHADVDAATDEGYGVDRQLAILGRHLPVDDPAPTVPEGVTVRASTPADDEAVAAVLAATYAGTPEAGWDLARYRERRALDWFDPDDVLLAVDPSGRLLGLHWLKRRAPGVGEVYNLAIHPDAQGRRLGAVLLRAGLDRLADTGCHDVLLWVDRANERAVRLYTSQGFSTRWEDVALGRTLRGSVT
jgi:mycothiol synthase